jgi:hypothetical protein
VNPTGAEQFAATAAEAMTVSMLPAARSDRRLARRRDEYTVHVLKDRSIGISLAMNGLNSLFIGMSS